MDRAGAAGARVPLLATAKRKPRGCLDEGSPGATVVMLCSAAIGTGVLALPYGASLVGVVPAVLLFALAGTAAFASNAILFDCALETGHGSYGELMEGILGKSGAMVLDILVFAEGLGAVACYLVFIMDYVPQVCALGGEDLWCTDKTNVAMAACAIIWPLSCFKSLSSLRYVSTCSIVTIVFTSAVVIAKAPSHFARTGRSFSEALSETKMNMNGFQVLSMACFAFMTHTNTPEIARQFAGGKAQSKQVLGIHTGLLWLVYCAIAVCGFISFFDGTSQDFLTNYELRDGLVIMCRVMLSATLVIACPVNMFPAMQALFNVLEGLRSQSRGSGRPSLYDSDSIRVPVSTACFALSVGVALKSPHVADMISMLGAYLSSPLMFAFPAIMYWRILGRQDMALPVALLLLTAALWLAELRLLF